MTRLRGPWFQHRVNPLHIYCRLIDVGLSVHISRRLSIFYEKHFYPSLLRGLRLKWNM